MALAAVRFELDRLEVSVIGIWLMAHIALVRQIDIIAILVFQTLQKDPLVVVSGEQVLGVIEADAASVLPTFVLIHPVGTPKLRDSLVFSILGTNRGERLSIDESDRQEFRMPAVDIEASDAVREGIFSTVRLQVLMAPETVFVIGASEGDRSPVLLMAFRAVGFIEGGLQLRLVASGLVARFAILIGRRRQLVVEREQPQQRSPIGRFCMTAPAVVLKHPMRHGDVARLIDAVLPMPILP